MSDDDTCHVIGCVRHGAEVFTVAAGARGMAGWPDGAPDIGARDLLEGDRIRMCPEHGDRLRKSVWNAKMQKYTEWGNAYD